jgi:hypothetical protein
MFSPCDAVARVDDMWLIVLAAFITALCKIHASQSSQKLK